MKRLSLFAFVLFTGCVSMEGPRNPELISFPEGMVPHDHEWETQLDLAEKRGIDLNDPQTRRDLRELLLGLTEEEFAAELDDCFIKTRLSTYYYWSEWKGKDLALFFSSRFLSRGWTVRRGLLVMELTNGGGDWVRVYQKGERQVWVHIVGAWDEKAFSYSPGTLRTVCFKFYKCRLEDVFQPDRLRLPFWREGQGE